MSRVSWAIRYEDKSPPKATVMEELAARRMRVRDKRVDLQVAC